MKKNTVVFAILALITVHCFADSIKWGMTLESFEKSFKTDLKYETDSYSIVYLPANSSYKNIFDEYLLFVNDVWNYNSRKRLVRRMQFTNYTVEECKQQIKKYLKYDKYTEEISLDFPLGEICSETDALQAFEEFPGVNSLPVVFITMENPSNYGAYYKDSNGYHLKSHYYGGLFEASKGDGDGYDHCTGLFLENGVNIIVLSDGYADYIGRVIDRRNIEKSFADRVEQIRLENIQKKEIEGPFGTYFGMKKSDLSLICKENSNITKDDTDIRTLDEKIRNYQEYYTVFFKCR